MKVFKPKQLMPGTLAMHGHAGQVYLGDYDRRTNMPDIPDGVVTLSLPYKKGRRKLVKGTIESHPYSSQYVGLVYELVFTPKNDVQEEKLFKLRPDLRD